MGKCHQLQIFDTGGEFERDQRQDIARMLLPEALRGGQGLLGIFIPQKAHDLQQRPLVGQGRGGRLSLGGRTLGADAGRGLLRPRC